MLKILLFLLLWGAPGVLQAQFLVKDQEYRCPPSDASCVSARHLPAFESMTTSKGNTFTINYVEFDDHGRPWNPRELQDALAEVRSARGPSGDGYSLVVVYIHGWQNNADEEPGVYADVKKFRDTLLQRLADEQPKEGGKPLKVVGIYLAWRGLTFTKEPFKHIISYWPRRGVARHVGQTGMYDAINQIETVVHEKRDHYVLVLAGHSFGARVLENAAEMRDDSHPGFMQRYRTQAKQLAVQRLAPEEKARRLNSNLPADLIFYVNAATASTVTRRVIRETKEVCQATPHAPICGADPFYLAVTSHADSATGIIMPIANLVFPAFTSDHFHLISAANTQWMHTHHDPVRGCSDSSDICFEVTPGQASSAKSISHIAGHTQLSDRTNEPFWIFNVGKDVMANHGDVWNPAVTDLVTRVITSNVQFQRVSAAALRAAP